MGTASIDISNRALEQCNVDPITSLEDQSKPARLCRRLVPQLAAELLRTLSPPFARRRALLPALVEPPLWGFAQQYELPADFVRFIGIENVGPTQDGCTIAWKIEGTLILTDEPAPLRISYVADVGTDQYDPLFTATLAARLAAEIVMPLTNDARLLQLLEKRQADRQADCRSAAFNEIADPVIRGASVLEARHA